MNEIEPSWVLDNVEVKKTGRVAKRTLTSGKLDIQVEVTPVYQMSGSWKKWVRETDLFEIAND